MPSPTEQSLSSFLDEVASERVAPAGGTAIAATGAMGAALCEMVCIHTLAARDADADTSSLPALRSDLERQRRSLLALAAQDAAVVDELFGGDGEGPSERLSKRAVGIPLAVAESCFRVLEVAERVTELGSGGVVADARIGASLAAAALQAALWMVRGNLDALSAPSFAADIADRADAIERAAADIADPFDT